MKIYLSDKTKSKIQDLYNNNKAGSISVRKAKKGDNEANIISGIKLTDSQRTNNKTGKSYSLRITKKLLEETKKFLEEKNGEGLKVHKGAFLPLIPLIIGAIGAVGGLAGGAAGIATAVINKQKADAEAEETRRHNLAIEEQARYAAMAEADGQKVGGCMECKSVTDVPIPSRPIVVEPGLKEVKIGNAAYLSPYSGGECKDVKIGSAAYLNPWPGANRGYGLNTDVKEFINNSKLDPIAKKALRNLLKNLQEHFKVTKKGKGILIS